MHLPRHRTTRRAAALAVAIALAAMVLAAVIAGGSPAAGSGVSPTAVARDAVDLQFQVLDGDSAAPLAGVQVAFYDQSNVQIGTPLVSDAQGLITLPAVDTTTLVTAVAQSTGKYTAFPVEAGAIAATPAQPIKIPMYRNDRQWLTWAYSNDRRHVGPATKKPKGTAVWRFDPKNMMEYPPCLAYGVVVYGSYHGYVNANRQSDGKLLWQYYPSSFDDPSKFANQVAVSSWLENGRRVARVYFADLTGKVGCLDLFTGHAVWYKDGGKGPGTGGRTIPFKSFEASPLIQGETVFLASRYNRNGSTAGLWALDRRTGDVRWFRKLGQTKKSKIGASPAYRNGRVFVAAYDGNVYAIDARSGKVKWRTKLGGSFYATPAIAGTRMYLGSNSNGVLYCLNTTNGRLLWQRDLGSSIHSSAAVYNGKLYLGVGRSFMAVKTKNGAPVWSFRTRTKVWGSATILSGLVYFSDFGKTYGLSSSTGKVVWSFNAGRYSPVTSTGNLIMVCGKRLLYAFKPSSR